MPHLEFKKFFAEHEDVRAWLLGGTPGDRFVPVPPPGQTPQELLSDLEDAERAKNRVAVRRALKAIEENGYAINTIRTLVPTHHRPPTAK